MMRLKLLTTVMVALVINATNLGAASDPGYRTFSNPRFGTSSSPQEDRRRRAKKRRAKNKFAKPEEERGNQRSRRKTRSKRRSGGEKQEKRRRRNPRREPQRRPSSPFSQTNNALEGEMPFGFHFRSMTANGVTIKFGQRRIGSVETIADPTGSRTFAQWGTELFVNDGTVFDGQNLHIKSKLNSQFGGPGGIDVFDYDLDCIADHENGSMRIRPSISMRSGPSATHVFHYCSVEFRIKPPGAGDPANCRVMLPGMAPYVVAWTDDVEIPTGNPRKGMHPAASRRGGNAVQSEFNPSDDSGIVEYDEPSGDIRPQGSAMSQCFYFWDHTTLKGLLVRTDDIVGQGKIYAISRDPFTQDIILQIRFIPQDNSVGVNKRSDSVFDYGVELRPMRGDWNHALEYDTKRKMEQGHPAFAKGRIKNRSDYPQKAKQMNCFAPNFGGFFAFDFTRYLEQNRRIKDYFNGEPWSVGSIWYGTGPGNLGESAPIYGPLTSSAIKNMKRAWQEEIGVIIYTIPIYNDKSTLRSTSPTLGIQKNLPLTRANYALAAEPSLESALVPFESEHIVIPARSGGTIYPYIDWSDAANNLEYARFITDQFAGIDLAGIYIDRGGADGPPPNDNPRLAPEDRGVGSKTWTLANRSISALMRQEMDGENTIIVHEWPSEFSIGEADIVTWESVGVKGFDTTQVFGPSAQFGEYVKHSTFHGFGRGASKELLLDHPDIASRTEVLNGTFLYWLMGGHMMPVQAFFDQRPDEYFIALEGEPDYELWFKDAIPHYEFLRRCWWTQPELVQRFHMSKRLHEMPTTSVVRRKIDERVGTPTQQSEYLYAQGWYDRDTDTLGFNCGNWTQTFEEGGYINAMESWTDTLTSADFPDLGDQPRNVELIDCGTGKVTSLPSYNGRGRYQINVLMPPGRVVWLVME